MSRRASHNPKIRGGIDEARAKMKLPKAVRNNSGNQRVGRVTEPVTKSDATIRFGGGVFEVQLPQDLRDVWRDATLRLHGIPTVE